MYAENEKSLRPWGRPQALFQGGQTRGKSAADLPPPAQQLSVSLAESGIQWVCIHVLQVGSIEDVVELEPDLEVESLFEAVVLVDGQVGLCKVRPAERVSLLVAFGADGRLRKLSGLEDTVQESRLGVSLRVGCNVREIEIRSVRIVIPTVRCQSRDRIRGRRACAGTARRRAERSKGVLVDDREWVTALEDAGAGKSPSAGQMHYQILPAMQARKLVVKGQRKAVRCIPRRRPVKLRRANRRGI